MAQHKNIGVDPQELRDLGTHFHHTGAGPRLTPSWGAPPRRARSADDGSVERRAQLGVEIQVLAQTEG